MNAKTHMVGGAIAELAFVDAAAASALEVGAMGPTSVLLCLGAAIVGSLAPDVDLYNSKSGQKVWPLSLLLHHTVGHRTLCHSPLMVALLYLGLSLLLPERAHLYILAFLAGFGSHLFLDMLNKAGIPLLYPSSKRFHLLSIKTGSATETLLFFCLCATAFVQIYALLAARLY